MNIDMDEYVRPELKGIGGREAKRERGGREGREERGRGEGRGGREGSAGARGGGGRERRRLHKRGVGRARGEGELGGVAPSSSLVLARRANDPICYGGLERHGDGRALSCKAFCSVCSWDVAEDAADPLQGLLAPTAPVVKDEGHKARAGVAFVLGALVPC